MTHPRMKVTITPRTVANPGLGATERCGSHGDRLGLSTCAVPRLGNVGQDARPSVEWREFTQEHPERVSPSSPGLGRRRYPGSTGANDNNPDGVASLADGTVTTPLGLNRFARHRFPG